VRNHVIHQPAGQITNPNSEMQEVARNFSIQLRGSAYWDLDTVHPMLAGLCIFILVEHKRTDLQRKLRTKLMDRLLNIIECVHPMTVSNICTDVHIF